MAERPISQLTLRELFKTTEILARDLVEHLEKNFLPRVHGLEQLVQPQDVRFKTHIPDVSVRRHASEALASDEFTQKQFKKINEYLAAIDQELARHASQM